MIKAISSCAPAGRNLNRVLMSRFGAYEEGDLKKAEEYVLETLRSRSWMDYMISSYYPKSLRTAFCTIQLFNLELIKISDNIREPSLGFALIIFRIGEIGFLERSH